MGHTSLTRTGSGLRRDSAITEGWPKATFLAYGYITTERLGTTATILCVDFSDGSRDSGEPEPSDM